MKDKEQSRIQRIATWLRPEQKAEDPLKAAVPFDMNLTTMCEFIVTESHMDVLYKLTPREQDRCSYLLARAFSQFMVSPQGVSDNSAVKIKMPDALRKLLENRARLQWIPSGYTDQERLHDRVLYNLSRHSAIAVCQNTNKAIGAASFLQTMSDEARDSWRSYDIALGKYRVKPYIPNLEEIQQDDPAVAEFRQRLTHYRPRTA